MFGNFPNTFSASGEVYGHRGWAEGGRAESANSWGENCGCNDQIWF